VRPLFIRFVSIRSNFEAASSHARDNASLLSLLPFPFIVTDIGVARPLVDDDGGVVNLNMDDGAALAVLIVDDGVIPSLLLPPLL
jgi:hypothetical protein